MSPFHMHLYKVSACLQGRMLASCTALALSFSHWPNLGCFLHFRYHSVEKDVVILSKVSQGEKIHR